MLATMIHRIATAAIVCLALNANAQHAVAPQAHAAAQPLFATVNGAIISAAEFNTSGREMFNNRFFHRTPPESELKAVLREFGQSMIDRLLIDQEIERRKVAPDAKAVQAELDQYDQRYGGSAVWAQQRDARLPALRAHHEQVSRRGVFEAKVRDVPRPDAKAARAFYQSRIELFTEPEKVRVANILLRVDPSSPAATWTKAEADIRALKSQIDAGESFESIAHKHSQDSQTATQGGDMGFLHRGMLSEEAQVAVDKMKVGEVSEPTRVLQGYILYKVLARQPAKVREFADVEQRATDLLQREQADAAWKAQIERLRNSAKVVIAPEFQEIMTEPIGK